MKKEIVLPGLLIILVVSIVLINVSNSTKVSSTDKPTIKIGAILPLSGDLAIIGQSIKKGIEFAIDEQDRKLFVV